MHVARKDKKDEDMAKDEVKGEDEDEQGEQEDADGEEAEVCDVRYRFEIFVCYRPCCLFEFLNFK